MLFVLFLLGKQMLCSCLAFFPYRGKGKLILQLEEMLLRTQQDNAEPFNIVSACSC